MIFLGMLQDFRMKSLRLPVSLKYLFSIHIVRFAISITLMCFSFNSKAQEKPFVVVLDAGHGGSDPGNRGGGYIEKNIALKIVLKIGEELERNPNIKVIYTRKTDVFIELIQRANIANKADADLFISVHCDAFKSSVPFGAGTFVLGLHANERNFQIAQKENSVIFLEEDYEKNYDGFDPNDPESVISLLLMQETYLDQSIVAANAIQSSFVENLHRKDRTVKQAGFVVLKYTYMPSVLIETGFLTNPTEGAFLNSANGQLQMANSIARAIENYVKQLIASVESTSTYTERIDNSADVQKGVCFKVQIAAGKKKIELKTYNFNGLEKVSRIQDKALYRYYYQETNDYNTAQRYLKQAKDKGFSSAFIVAFLNGKKITISEALRSLN